jgi:hypothetical protein
MNDENQNQNVAEAAIAPVELGANGAFLGQINVPAGGNLNIAAGLHMQLQGINLGADANLVLGAGAQIIAHNVHMGPNVGIILEEGAQFLQVFNDGALVPVLGDDIQGE